jgi:anti-sigma factor RsiW
MRYVFDELSDADRSRFDGHVAGCLDCRNYLHSYRLTVTLGREAFARPEAPCDDALPPELVRAILAAAGH